MLRRKIYSKLKRWKAGHGPECLLIQGARQVGKSYIVAEFGEHEYASFVSIDFIEQPALKEIFSGSLDADDIYSRMTLLLPGIKLIPGNTLIFLDEIQECPEARSALKYLALDGRFDVIASGSLLGIRFREAKNAPSLPVGYERPLTLHPLDFEEYLWAAGYDDSAIDTLRGYFERLDPIPQSVHSKMMGLLREYLAIGGMPAVVKMFRQNRDYGEAHQAQSMLHSLYLDDMARYAPPGERAKARACYLSLPRQLAKENTKFQYSIVEPHGTARKFNGSVAWLVGAEMALVCRSVSTPLFPLAAYEEDRFRLYANDTGMLMAMYGFDMKAAVVSNQLKGPMKGGLYENLIGGMLAKKGIPLRYWTSTDAKREIEFLVDCDASVVPVEVKAKKGATASLNSFFDREEIRLGYKLIDGNIGRAGKKVTLPLYLAMFLFGDAPR